MKKILVLLLFSLSLSAQNTTVSGTIVDTDGTTWANGSWNAQLINPNGGTPLYCGTTTPVQTRWPASGGSSPLNSSGQFSQSMADNTQVCPAGTTWQFTFASNTSAAASQITALTIAGATFNISTYATLNINPPRIKIGNLAGIYAYTDAEIVNQSPGNAYWNVVTLATRQWTGSVWQNLVTSSWNGGTVVNPIAAPSFSCTGSPSTCYNGNLVGNVNGVINEQSLTQSTLALRMAAAFTACGTTVQCIVEVPVTEGTGTWTAQTSNNISVLDLRYIGGAGFATNNQPYLHSTNIQTLFLGANQSFESNVNSGMFTNDCEVTAYAGGTSAQNGYANAGCSLIFVTRTAGNRPIWGQDINVQASTLGSSVFGTEYDIVNNAGVNDTSDIMVGLGIIASGANNPGAAITITGSAGTNWEDAIIVDNYSRSGMQFTGVSGRNFDLGFYPPADDNAIENVGFNHAHTSVVWEQDDNGNYVTNGAINGANIQIGGHAGGVIIIPAGTQGYHGGIGYMQMSDNTGTSGNCAAFNSTLQLTDAGHPCALAIPLRGGTWTITSATSQAVTFSTNMAVAPSSCSVTAGGSTATTGTPFVVAASLATTGFTVSIPNSGTLSGTYLCGVNNAN